MVSLEEFRVLLVFSFLLSLISPHSVYGTVFVYLVLLSVYLSLILQAKLIN